MTAPDLSHAIGLPSEQAIKYFKAKDYKIPWNWHEMWQEAHAVSCLVKCHKLGLLKIFVIQLEKNCF